ncbi:MAG: carbohydrate-binding domain-containing protein [Prevotella sp.]|jgi:hypothetical protein
MRKFYALALLLGLSTANAVAQTLNVVVGNVTYAVPASEAGTMTYSDGTSLTILNKTFSISDIDNIYVDDTEVTDDAVTVTYNGTSASVVVAGNVMQYLTVNVTDANVSILQSEDLAEEINYTLTGTSTDGSFYMDGDYKATLTLSDLTLTSADSAAINIENGKRIAIDVEGTNTLADASDGDQKACFMVNGHSEFTGSGSLSITGNTKHGFWGDEYVQLKKTFTGSITIASAVKDGMSINQYFEMNNGTVTVTGTGDDGIQVETTDDTDDDYNGQVMLNGGTLNVTVSAEDVKAVKCDSAMTITDDAGYSTTVNITCESSAYAAKGLKSGGDMTITGGTFNISTAGKGVWDDDDSSASACAALKSDGNMAISGGTFTLTATGSGGKGINADGTLTISGGDITISTSGGLYYNNGSTENTNYTGDTDNISDDYTSSPKGIKVDGNVTISGGTIDVTTTGNNGEGIESKAVMTISDGTITVNSYDDGLNCSSHLYITGGTVTVVAANNDGLDANGNIYISGGTVAAYGASGAECGIDAAEGYAIYITGGTVLGVGGSSSNPSSTTNSQAYVSTTSSVSASSTITLKSGSTTLASFTVPSNYSGSSSNQGGFGGPGGSSRGGSNIMISASGLTSGSSYTLTSGSTSTTVTAKK